MAAEEADMKQNERVSKTTGYDAEDIWRELSDGACEATVGGESRRPEHSERLTMAGARVKRARSSGLQAWLPAGLWRMTGLQWGLLAGGLALLLLLIVLVLLLAMGIKAPAIAGESPRKEGKYTFLLAGTDQDGLRTDTMMLCSLDTRNKTAAVMSLPRDTLLLQEGVPTKLNAVYAYGGTAAEGMTALCDAVTAMLGLPIDGYCLVSLETFAEAIDLLGGVEYNVPMAMQYADPYQDLYIELQPGLQRLDGESAAHLLRFRSGYYNADLGRVEVQQDFLRAMLEQCLQLAKFPRLASAATVLSEKMVTNLSTGNLVWIAMQLLQIDALQTDTMPGSADGIYLQGQNYYVIYGLDTLALLNEVYSPLMAEITLDNVNMMRLSGQAIVYADGTFYTLAQ